MEVKTINKYGSVSTNNLQKKAVKIFNEFIRLRDSDENGNFICIACGKPKPKGQLQAGHYYPSGQNPVVRLDERNVNGECVHCNYYSGEHLIWYKKRLIEKIGSEELESLEMKAEMGRQTVKVDRFAMIDIIETYTGKVKQLRKYKNY